METIKMATVYLCGYTTDAGRVVNIELDSARGHAGIFPPGNNSNGPPLPLHGKFLRVRGVYGKNGTKRMFLPVALASACETIYASGSFTAGLTYTITGKRGERDTTTTPLP